MIGRRTLIGLAVAMTCVWLTGCSTAPKQDDMSEVLSRSRSTRYWFESRVPGLKEQINRSAGIIVFPDVAQWGIVFGGGSFGRGVLFDPNGKQLGWSAINNASVGLQAGVQGFKMLMVLENQSVLADFKAGKWNGSANGVLVLAEQGASGAAPFQQGLAVYQGANAGLMVGVSVGLNNIRFESVNSSRD